MQRQQFCHLRDLSFLVKGSALGVPQSIRTKFPRKLNKIPRGNLWQLVPRTFCIFSYYRICYVDGVFFCGINMTKLLSYIGWPARWWIWFFQVGKISAHHISDFLLWVFIRWIRRLRCKQAVSAIDINTCVIVSTICHWIRV